jgi:hypothetical protein
MKATLSTHTEPKQLTMPDLKPGDIAIILPNDISGDYEGAIVTAFAMDGKVSCAQIGETKQDMPPGWWTCKNFVYPVRLLTPGESILIQ